MPKFHAAEFAQRCFASRSLNEEVINRTCSLLSEVKKDSSRIREPNGIRDVENKREDDDRQKRSGPGVKKTRGKVKTNVESVLGGEDE